MKEFKKIGLIIGLLLYSIINYAQIKEEETDTTQVFSLSKSAIATQSNIALPNLAYTTPTSMEFQKYMGYPISLATGVPEINIPLYTIDVRGYQLPITLNYHASGIKVEQTPFPIGYGWSMFPAARIDRVILGKIDERYLNENDIKSSYAFDNVSDVFFLAEAATPVPGYNNFESPSYVSHKDVQHDIFSIQLPNYSGNFILRIRDGEIEVKSIPDSPLKIQVLTQGDNITKYIEGFDVIDENGIIYKFGCSVGNIDKSYLEYVRNSTESNIITGWLLHKIVLPGADNNEITYSYSRQIFLDNFSLYKDINTQQIFDQFNGRQPLNYGQLYFGTETNPTCFPELMNFDESKTLTNVTVLPVEINFPGGRVSLTYNPMKEGDCYIEQMTVYSTNQTNPVKEIRFERNNAEKFLLKTLIINNEEYYRFDYNGQRFQNIYSQDFWGYYNGYANNRSMLPKFNLPITCSSPTYIEIGHANREVNEQAMKANILEKITYPTGGTTEFEYEVNKYKNIEGNTKLAGGLRIKKMKISDPLSGDIIKTYKYGSNEDGLGKAAFDLSNEHFLSENWLWQHGLYRFHYRIRRQTLSELPINTVDLYFRFNPPVWYEKVTEYSSDSKTESYYKYKPDVLQYDANNRYYFFASEYNSLVSSSPKLDSVRIFKKEAGNYQLLHCTKNSYRRVNTQRILGLKIDPYIIIYPDNRNSAWCEFVFYYKNNYRWLSILNDNIANYFTINNYYINTGIEKLTYKTEIDYSGTYPVKKINIYDYDSGYPFNLCKHSEIINSGDTLHTQYYYPNHDNNTMCNTLLDGNFLTTIIRERVSKNSAFLQSVHYNYKKWGNNIISPLSVETQNNMQSSPETRIKYHNYDKYGNPVYITKDDADKVVYLWSYNGRYPVAKIKNATYAEVETAVKSAFSVTNIDALAGQATPNETKLKNGSLQNALPNAIVTTYTFKPLVGMLTMTDPRGVTVQYEYDNVGRLKQIKDMNGKLIEKYDYHYKNQ